MLAGGCSGRGSLLDVFVVGSANSGTAGGGEPVNGCGKAAVANSVLLSLTSNQVGVPAELKHINKRRKRNQPGLPQ